jgi:serine/threonine protein kinase
VAALLAARGYALARQLGSGGMGEVYEVEDRVAGESLALKVLAARLADRPAMGARMAEEARALGQLRHPNVVALRAAGALPDGRPFVAMELLRGRTLDVLTRSHGPVPPFEAVRYVRALLCALDATHRAGLVHCDVKPSNVFVCDDGAVKLLDFGAAERAALEPAPQAVRWRQSTLAELGTVGPRIYSRARTSEVVGARVRIERMGSRPLLGTPRYMAPERRAGGPATARCDVYAVGLVLEQLLVPDEPHATALLRIARRASAASPGARFASARQMDRALRAAERVPCRCSRPNGPSRALEQLGCWSESPDDPQDAFDACSAAFFS